MITETDIRKIKSEREYTSYIIFLCFAAGLIFSCKGGFEIPADKYIPGFMDLSFYMTFVILVSASVFGPLLFPLASFFLGAINYASAENIIESFLTGGGIDIKLLIFLLTALPIFFVLSVKGTEASKLVIKALSSQSMAAKDRYNRNSFPVYAGIMLLLFAAFILTEIKA